MAAVTLVRARPVSPVGFEFKTVAAEAKVALTAGQLVRIDAQTPKLGFPFVVDLLATGEADDEIKLYVAITDAKAGAVVNIADDLEMDGWTGLSGDGAALYPSAATAGAIATDVITIAYVTTPDIAVPVRARMWTLTPTRIKFNL